MSDTNRLSRFRLGQTASQITAFNGSRVPSDITNYIEAVRDRLEGNYEEQRSLISMSMEGTAKTWLNKLKATPAWTSMSGEDVLRIFKEAYYPANYAEAALNSLHRIERGSRSLEAYLVEFTDLLQEIPPEAYNEMSARVCLINGVGEPYSKELRRQNHKTFNESFDFLQRQVNTLTVIPGSNPSKWPHPDSMEIDHVTTTATTAPPSTTPSTTPRQYHVGVDLTQMTRTEINAINAEAAAMSVCWYCKQAGHLMRDCRRRQNDRRRQATTDASKKRLALVGPNGHRTSAISSAVSALPPARSTPRQSRPLPPLVSNVHHSQPPDVRPLTLSDNDDTRTPLPPSPGSLIPIRK
ncbi:hypothetical protein OXX69_005052, partial [Metschnikowia pulcherrima]